MSQQISERIDSAPMVLEVRILVERVRSEDAPKLRKPHLSSRLVNPSGQPILNDIAVQEPICLIANGLETKSDVQQTEPTLEQELAAIGPPFVDEVCGSELETIRIDYDQSQPAEKKKDYILPVQDWLFLAAIVLFEAVVFLFLLGN